MSACLRETSSIDNNPQSGYVGVIAAGTKEFTFSVYEVPGFKEISKHVEKLTAIVPQEGWFEQDPREIMSTVHRCCSVVLQQLSEQGISEKNINAVGITNQRETTIVWDAITSKPLYNAILWKDIRTRALVDKYVAQNRNDPNAFLHITGTPMSTYFSVMKIRWLIENVPEVQRAIRDGRCKFGTVDSWIIWNLTNAHFHVTDVTNASRTMLMNIGTLQWDPFLLETFNIDEELLPDIRSCSEFFGYITRERFPLYGVRIFGVIGNQHASLLGQMCVKPGMAKNSYRSGCFFMCNTGDQLVKSKHGLATTIAYKFGPNAHPVYAIEGSIAIAGHAFTFLTQNLHLMPNSKMYEEASKAVSNTGGVYFVPALTGLYAPYWNLTARGLIIGLTQYTTKNHIIRAALESICFQTCDVLKCVRNDCGIKILEIHADGDMAKDLLLQLQADLSGVDVRRFEPTVDTVSLGAALCAAIGVELYEFNPNVNFHSYMHTTTFHPKVSDDERNTRYGFWLRAVDRSLGWVEADLDAIKFDKKERKSSKLKMPSIIKERDTTSGVSKTNKQETSDHETNTVKKKRRCNIL